MPTYKGLDGIYVKESKVCFIDGQNSRLYYRGYDIESLAVNSNFEEVAFLLISGRLPTSKELAEFRDELAQKRKLPDVLKKILMNFPTGSHPMDVLRTIVSAIGTLDPRALTQERNEQISKLTDLLAKSATISTAFHRFRNGLSMVDPREDLNHASNFLYMLTGSEPSEYEARVMDIGMILHAEHEMNASAFACMVTASTLADLYSAICSGIGALRGPLHGGANEGALRGIMEASSPEKAEEYVDNVLSQGKRIIGFGHRVYRNFDPRYRVLKREAEKLSELKGQSKLYNTAVNLEEAAIKRLAAKNLFPNVDYYSGLVFHILGIPTDMFTSVFAISRIAGWAAHVLEYLEDNRLIRPEAYYIGDLDLEYIPIQQRKS